MRLLTWNIQGGGGRRIPSIVGEIAQLQPDVVGLTEVTFKNLQVLRLSLVDRGFEHIATTCSAGNINSVLVASKLPFKVVDDPVGQDQERWLTIEFEGSNIKVLCVHIPGGTDNKFAADGVGISGKKRKELMWDEVIRFARQHRGDKAILLGDFNTGLPEDAQGTPFALSDYMRLLRLEKYVDTWRQLNPHAREFTWYTKRKNKGTGVSEDYNGFRLDYVFVSPALRDEIVDVRHVHEVRTNGISDHAIVLVDLSAIAGADRMPKTLQATGSMPNHEHTGSATYGGTEVPNPDPSLDSLVAALTKARIAAGNHEFIRRFTSEIGITSYRVVDRPDKPYVVASRRDGKRDLHIFYGYTTGFTSEKELVRLFGAGAGSNVNSPKGTWWVEHPVNRVRPSSKPSRDVRRGDAIDDRSTKTSPAPNQPTQMCDVEPDQRPEPVQPVPDPQADRASKDAAEDYYDDVQVDGDHHPAADQYLISTEYPFAARYLSSTEVARYLGLAGVKSLSRMKLPSPDAIVGGIKGWRLSTIEKWNETRPGRGRWGRSGRAQ